MKTSAPVPGHGDEVYVVHRRPSVVGTFLATVGALVIVLAVSCAVWKWPVDLRRYLNPSISVRVNDEPLTRDTKFATSFAPVVKHAAASVVNVYSTKTLKTQAGPNSRSILEDPLLREFFGNQFGQQMPQSGPLPKQHSLGSGVIVSPDGHILTNNHVVAGADEVKVGLLNGDREFKAKVVGRDPLTDVAVLQIDGKDLPVLTLADSDKIAVGDVVLAIGNPFGVGQTVTMGIISATRRGGMGIEELEDFIQTDAAINPGNSGGALVDTDGRLVGLNTAILSGSGGNQGVGFAVPANLVRYVMEQILKNGRVIRGSLGVNIQNLTPELRREFHAPDGRGVLVGGVLPNGPAAQVGLKSGDVITELNGQPVQDSRGLKLSVAQIAPGTQVSLKALRDGKEQAFTVTLKEGSNQANAVAQAVQKHAQEEPDEAGELLPGVIVQSLDDALRQRLNAPSEVHGVVIVAIQANSNAGAAGLQQGDIIEEINHHAIKTPEDAVAAVKQGSEKRFLLLVWSGGGSRFVMVDESNAG